MRERKTRLLASITMLCLFAIGFAMVPVVRAENVTTFEGTIAQGDWMVFEVELQEGLEACVEVVPYSESDLDMYVWGPNGEIITQRATIEGSELGYFIIPYDGVYSIEINAYWTASSEPVDFILTVTTGEDIIPESEPIEPIGNTYGDLQSWVKCHRVGLWHADAHAGFRRFAWNTFDILWYSIGASIWERPLPQFNADDALAVGQFTIEILASDYDGDISTVRDYLESISVFHYIDGVALSEHTKLVDGPVRPQHDDQGVLLYFFKRMDAGHFKSGELADAIGLGIHELTTIITWPDGTIETHTGAFELVRI